MKDSWWVVCFEPVFVEFGSPFLGLETFQGAWILLHKGMVRHSSSYLSAALPPPIYTGILVPIFIQHKNIFLLGGSVMALRDGEAVTALSICCPATPGLILELHHL